jgi:hypothetical protein
MEILKPSRPIHDPGQPRRPEARRTVPSALRSPAAAVLFAAGIAAGLLHAPAQLAVALRWPPSPSSSPTPSPPFAAGLDLLRHAGRRGTRRRRAHIAAQTHFLGDIFLRLIRMIVAPLIFGGIVTGIAGHNQLSGVGRVAIKALIFFEVVTTFGLSSAPSPSTSRRPAPASRCPPSSSRRAHRASRDGSRFCSTSFPRTSPRPLPKIRSSRSPSSRCSSARRWPRCPSPSARRCSACCNRSPKPCSASPASSW